MSISSLARALRTHFSRLEKTSLPYVERWEHLVKHAMDSLGRHTRIQRLEVAVRHGTGVIISALYGLAHAPIER
jgi:hypothetical protein